MGLFNKFKKMFQSEKVEPVVQTQPEATPVVEPVVQTDVQVTQQPTQETVVYDWSESEATEADSALEVDVAAVVEPEVQQEQVANDYHDKMGKTRSGLLAGFNDLMARFRTVDEEYFEELEDILIMADVGVKTVMELTDQLRHEVKVRNVKQPSELNEVIVEKMYEIYQRDGIAQTQLNIQPTGPTVILFVGVNGVGKTTTIAKLAHRFKAEGKSVIMAAGDTFRAGAVDQLQVWGDRLGVEVVKTKPNGDPSAVMFDAIDRAKQENIDIVLCDTAGRLQNKVNLMNELEKINRIIQRELPGAPHETLLVIDATTGQNGLSQAKAFTEVTPISGVVLSKVDGTAKGGIVLAIRADLGTPVKFIGLGEKPEDLQPFDVESYLYGLFADLF
ncbi:MAG: signal recognition particle-docking protein FtsY [Culicoidibacterales bacterium]